MRIFAAPAIFVVLTAAATAAEENGARAFETCRACHSLHPTDQGLPGPNLNGVVGRKIGGDPAFDYSPALRKARDDGLRWDAARLETFIADPAGMFRGLWMSMRGIEGAAQRQALVRFLADPASR